MTIKKILVPLDGSKESLDVLDTALIVAGRFGSHIEALHIKRPAVDSIPFTFNALSEKLKQQVIAETERDVQERADEIRGHFESFCKKNNVTISARPGGGDGPTASWREDTGDVAEGLVRRGRLADVVCIARPGLRESVIQQTAIGENLEAVLLRSGRPVLIVPPSWKPHRVAHAAIGWNESQEVSRALAMTMPWLPQMAEVSIIVSKKRQPRVNELVDYLAWHGVDANVHLLDGRSVGDAMLNICKDIGAEFLIVGGFSRARARQMLFGGVTRHLLERSEVITVMVH